MTAGKQLWRNRKEKKEWARRLQSEDPGLEVVHPHAAGIDVGNSTHYVAVRPDRDPEPVRRFECFTADLHRLADWLLSCGVKTVAMQSTGVYWIPLYEILEEHGLEVYLVNARHTKNLPGRKSDVQESQWLLKLHTYGLLNNSFQPVSEIRVLRTYWRQRGEHVRGAATCIQRMQKAQVKSEANPYDPADETYFEKREADHMLDAFQGTRTLRFLWHEQRGLCSVCNTTITRTTGWRLHYCVPRVMGGSRSVENRVLLHPECHNRVHDQRIAVSKPRLPSGGVRRA